MPETESFSTVEQSLLHLHNFLRWVVLALLVASIIRSVTNRNAFTGGGRRLTLYTLISAHTQLVLGLVLYISRGWLNAWSNIGAIMKSAESRFFPVEHALTNIIAIALITIGYSRAKRAATPQKAWASILLFFALALVLILVMIPWPWSKVNRALFPGL